MTKYSAICGLISSVLFVIPAIRQEMRRQEYQEFKKNNNDTNDEKLAVAVSNFMLRASIKWNLADSICIFLVLVQRELENHDFHLSSIS
jgi:hypothetical protein